MNIKSISFILIFLFSSLLFGQRLEWAMSIGSVGTDQVGAMSSDQFGNIYTTGRFQGLVDFDFGSGLSAVQSNGGSDIFVAKYSKVGQLIWVKSIGGTSTVDLGRGVVANQNGDVYLTGFFAGQVDFDPSPTASNILIANGEDAFLLKLNSNGVFQWVVQFGGVGNEESRSLDIDNAGNVYLSGYFSNSFTYPFLGNTSTLVSSGGDDIFMLKVTPNGTVNWAQKIGGTGDDLASFSKIDASNALYLCGDFERTVDFDPSSVTNSKTSSGSTDFFVARFDTSGQLSWVQAIGGSAEDHATGLDVYAGNHVYVGGYYKSNSTDFDPGTGVSTKSPVSDADGFVLSLNSTGSFRWVNSFGGAFKDVVGGVITDFRGNVYATGYFLSTVNFNQAGPAQFLTSAGNTDTYILKSDSTGGFAWVGHFSGSSQVVGTRFTITSPNNLVVGGSYEATADFDPQSGTHNLSSNGNRDFFLVDMNLCELSMDSMSMNSCEAVLSPSGKYIWTTSGIYLDTVSNSFGCDSALYIDLTIDSVRNVALQINSCGPYTSPSGNYQWATSGIYMDTLATQLGCDSILTINLSVYSSSSSTFADTACNTYRSPSGKIYNSGGFYNDTIPNQNGCDSLIGIFLTMYHSSTSSQNVIACNQYVSPSNKIYTATGTYYDTVATNQFCDSIITTNLTIQNLNLQIVQIGSQLVATQNGVSYQWLDCSLNFSPIANATAQSFTPTATGNYAVELDNGNCADTSNCINMVITGIDEYQEESFFEIYPNPSSGMIQIHSKTLVNELKLYDSRGKLSKVMINNFNQIDLSNLSEGLYFIQAETESGTIRKKIILNR